MPAKRKTSNKSRISIIARSAWSNLTRNGAIDEDFDAWRKREAIECVGVRISQATSPQLDRLETHFLALGGQAAKAYDHATGEDGQTKRTRHAIQLLADQLGLTPNYASTKPAHQLQAILITLTKQARQARKQSAHHSPSDAVPD